MAPVAVAVRIAEHPDVYILPMPGFATPLIAVLCNDLKEAPLPDAALIMRDLLLPSSDTDQLHLASQQGTSPATWEDATEQPEILNTLELPAHCA